MGKLTDPVIIEHDKMLKEIFNDLKTMPTIECSKRIASWSATFLEQLIIAKREHARAEFYLEQAKAQAFADLKWKNDREYKDVDARQATVLAKEVEEKTFEAQKYELRVTFFDQALKAIGNHTWTLNYLVKFYSTNRDELFS